MQVNLPYTGFQCLCTTTLERAYEYSYMRNRHELLTHPTTLNFISLNLLVQEPTGSYQNCSSSFWLRRAGSFTGQKQNIFHWKPSLSYFILLKYISISAKLLENPEMLKTLQLFNSLPPPSPNSHLHPLHAGKGWRPGILPPLFLHFTTQTISAQITKTTEESVQWP